MIFMKILGVLPGNDVLPGNRSAGAGTPGRPDRTAFHSNRSFYYAFRSKAARSNLPDAPSSGIFMKHSG